MIYLGDFVANSTVRGMWNSNAVAGESITRATNGSIRIYKNSTTTERSSSAGITDTEDFDSLTGVHQYVIDLSDNTDADFYAAGNDYFVVLAAATIDGKTINAMLGMFSIENRKAILHTSQPAVTFTSLTVTGALTVNDGFIITCSTSGRSAIQATGNGTGHGIFSKSGTGTTGSGIYSQSQATNGHGIIGVATGTTGNGIYGYGGTSTGNGIKGQGGDSGGYGIEATAASGSAIHAQATSGYGFEVVAGGTNMSAVKLTPTGTGYGINGTIASVVALGTGAITTSSFAAGAINAAVIADDAIDGGSVAASAVTKIQTGLSTLTTADIPTEAEIDAVLSLAHGAGSWATATGFAVAGDAMTLTTGERAAVADKILNRNINGGGDGTRTVEESLAVLRNKSAISGGTLTVYDTDDATSLWTATVTSSASADPITGVDPA